MRPGESTYPNDWRRIAKKDLGRAERMLQDDDPEAAGFYLQQAIEKHFKAFLLSKGWSLKRIHDLETLLNEALPYAPFLEKFRPLCQKVTGFYMIERYPFSLQSEVSMEDVRNSLTEGKQLISMLEK